MSGKMVGLIFDDFPGSPLEKLTALAMAEHASHDGAGIRPGIPLLVEKTGLSTRTVQRHIQRMIDLGWLEVVRNGNGRGNVTEYRIPAERIKGVTSDTLYGGKKGVTVTPFSERKGVTHDKKGCHPRQERVSIDPYIVCEPSVNRHEPSTTAGPECENASTYLGDFERAWQAYPKRAGSNPKPRALKAWRARLREGVSPETLYLGVVRYRDFCQATGKLYTEFILQASTFFGPDKRYDEPWAIPETPGGTHATRQPVDHSAIGQIRAANERARRGEVAERGNDAPAVGAHGDDLRPPLEGEFRLE